MINSTTLHDIIVLTTQIQPSEIQPDVFHFHPGNPCYTEVSSMQLNQSQMPACTDWKTFDYWEGSAGPYIGTIFSLGLYTILLCVLVYLGKRYKEGNLWGQSRKRGNDIPTYGGSVLGEGVGVIRLVADELKVCLLVVCLSQSTQTSLVEWWPFCFCGDFPLNRRIQSSKCSICLPTTRC